MMEKAFGRTGYFVISLIQFIYPFIAMVSYNVIVGDTITQVVSRLFLMEATDSSIFVSREFISFITSVLVTLPFSLYRDIGKLAKVSLVSMIFVVFILISVYVRIPHFKDVIPASEDAWQLVNFSGSIQAISVMTFAFMCHHNTFLLYCSIDNTSMSKWNKVTHASLFISFITMTLMAYGGYATFTSTVQGDLLNNYCWNDDLMNVSRLLFSITILLTYPIECFVCREVLQHIFWGKMEDQDVEQSRKRHVVMTLVLVLATYALSLVTDCLGIVLEINGLVAAIPLAFIIPALCYMKLEEGPLLSQKKGPALLLALFGIAVTTFGTIVIMTKGSGECQDVGDMPYCRQLKTSSHIVE